MNLDPALVEAARQGEAEALHDLLVQCHPDASRFARAVCATPEDAEDAVQETLWIVSQRIGSLRVVGAFASWLFQVVKHECFRMFRRQHSELLGQAISEHRYEPESAALNAALLRDIAAAIAALPPKYRQVLIMRDVEEMTAPEVARSLDLTAGAVKSRLHRARGIVRASLGQRLD